MNRTLVVALVALAVAAGLFYGRRTVRPVASPAQPRHSGSDRRDPARRPGRLHVPGDEFAPRSAALVRPGTDAHLRVQSRRRGANVPQGHGARSGVRDVLVGRRAGARTARQQWHGPGEQPAGVAAAATRNRTGAAGERARAGLHPRFGGALCGESTGRPAPARRGLRASDRPARRRTTGRPRRSDLPRRGTDGPAAVGLLRRAVAAQGKHGGDRLDPRVRDGPRPGSCRRVAPVRACSRGVRRSATRRRGCRSTARADPGLGAPRAHAGPHLRARWPLARRRHRQPEGDRGRRCLPRHVPRQRARPLPARLRAAQPSLPVVRREHGRRERRRARCGAADGRARQPAGADATAGLRRVAALLDDAVVRPRPLRPLGRDRRGGQSGARPALRDGDLALRPGDGGAAPGAARGRREALRRAQPRWPRIRPWRR